VKLHAQLIPLRRIVVLGNDKIVEEVAIDRTSLLACDGAAFDR